MPDSKPSVNHLVEVVLVGSLTATDFLHFSTACQDYGVMDAAYLFGYAVWPCAREVYVFVGEGPDA